MPMYEYHCDNCPGIFDRFRPMAKRNDLATCMDCGSSGAKLTISASNVKVFNPSGGESSPANAIGYEPTWHYGLGCPNNKRDINKTLKKMDKEGQGCNTHRF